MDFSVKIKLDCFWVFSSLRINVYLTRKVIVTSTSHLSAVLTPCKRWSKRVIWIWTGGGLVSAEEEECCRGASQYQRDPLSVWWESHLLPRYKCKAVSRRSLLSRTMNRVGTRYTSIVGVSRILLMVPPKENKMEVFQPRRCLKKCN